jgi:urease accessory protein
MFAVGLWAAQRGGRALWLVPLTFVSIMTVGGALGMAHVSIPFAEQGIVLSVILLGVFVAAAVRLPVTLSAAIVGLFAIAHGYAHGLEIPSSASGVSYALGFAAATASLHAAGIGFGLVMRQMNSAELVRLAGAAIAISGLFLGIG